MDEKQNDGLSEQERTRKKSNKRKEREDYKRIGEEMERRFIKKGSVEGKAWGNFAF